MLGTAGALKQQKCSLNHVLSDIQKYNSKIYLL